MSHPKSPNHPSGPVHPPADRHYVSRASKTMSSKERTTLIVPGVDVQGDIAAIREGRAVRAVVEDGAEQFTLNGRIWQRKPEGTLFPVAGNGFIGPVDQPVMLAIKAYARYNGSNEQSEYFLDRQEGDEHAREIARQIWNPRK